MDSVKRLKNKFFPFKHIHLLISGKSEALNESLFISCRYQITTLNANIEISCTLSLRARE